VASTATTITEEVSTLGTAMAGLEIADLQAPGGGGLMQHR